MVRSSEEFENDCADGVLTCLSVYILRVDAFGYANAMLQTAVGLSFQYIVVIVDAFCELYAMPISFSFFVCRQRVMMAAGAYRVGNRGHMNLYVLCFFCAFCFAYRFRRAPAHCRAILICLCASFCPSVSDVPVFY